jgi:hypothetical protein
MVSEKNEQKKHTICILLKTFHANTIPNIFYLFSRGNVLK